MKLALTSHDESLGAVLSRELTTLLLLLLLLLGVASLAAPRWAVVPTMLALGNTRSAPSSSCTCGPSLTESRSLRAWVQPCGGCGSGRQGEQVGEWRR